MKCRVVQKGERFYAQYERTKSLKSGKFSRTRKEWETLNNRIIDQKEGERELGWFETMKAAESALRKYAEEHSEGIVVKEFEA